VKKNEREKLAKGREKERGAEKVRKGRKNGEERATERIQGKRARVEKRNDRGREGPIYIYIYIYIYI